MEEKEKKYRQGKNPNSLANLEKRTSFKPGEQRAVEAAYKSHEAQTEVKTFRKWVKYFEGKTIVVLNPDGTREDVPTEAAEAQALVRKAAAGDIKAIELLLKVKGELEDKVRIDMEEPGLLISFKNKKKEDAGD